jgi:hypothetical protein
MSPTSAELGVQPYVKSGEKIWWERCANRLDVELSRLPPWRDNGRSNGRTRRLVSRPPFGSGGDSKTKLCQLCTFLKLPKYVTIIFKQKICLRCDHQSEKILILSFFSIFSWPRTYVLLHVSTAEERRLIPTNSLNIFQGIVMFFLEFNRSIVLMYVRTG